MTPFLWPGVINVGPKIWFGDDCPWFFLGGRGWSCWFGRLCFEEVLIFVSRISKPHETGGIVNIQK